MNPLGSPHPYTPRPVIQNGRHDSGAASRTTSSRRVPSRQLPLEPCLTIPTWFQALFTPARGAFQLSLTVLVRYRSWDVFRVGRPMPPRFPRDIQRTVLRNFPRPELVAPTGLSPSMAGRSRPLRLPNSGLIVGSPTTPHPPYLTAWGSVCPVPLSVAPTQGIPVGFFSCGY